MKQDVNVLAIHSTVLGSSAYSNLSCFLFVVQSLLCASLPPQVSTSLSVDPRASGHRPLPQVQLQLSELVTDKGLMCIRLLYNM